MSAMIRTIGVGVGSTGGWQAVSWAVEEALAANARLVIHHIHPLGSRPPGSFGATSTAAWEPHDPALSAAVACARTRLGGSRVSIMNGEGAVGSALCRASADVDLLVIGGGRSGATAHDVARHAACPVVVIRPVRHCGTAAFAGHVVIGVDGSPAGRDAVEFGFQYAAAHRLPVAAAYVSGRAVNDYFYDDTTLSTHFIVEPIELELLAVEVEPWERIYPHLAVRRAVLAGERLPGLIRAGVDSKLLVVGRRARRPRVAAVGGGLISNLVHDAPVTIAVVPEGSRRPNRGGSNGRETAVHRRCRGHVASA